MCRGENLFCAIAGCESLDLAAQDNRESQIALSDLVNQFATRHDTSFSQRLKQRKLVIVQLGKSDVFCIAIKPFVVLFVWHHFRHFTR